MSELSDAFDELTDTGMWENVAVLAAGFLGSIVLENTVEFGSVDFPDEAYGVTAAVVAYYVLDGEYRNSAMMGAGLYTGDKLAQRFGVRSQIMGAVQ